MTDAKSTNADQAAADQAAADQAAADQAAADQAAADQAAADQAAADQAAADQAAADQAAADQAAAADEAAQKAGFADAQAQEDAKKAAANQPKREKAPKAAKPMSAKVLANGIDQAKELLASGELTIGFGDDRNLNVDIPRAPANLRMFNGQLVTLDKIVMRTSDLRRITTVTYAYLLHEKKVLAVREMGAPIRTEPNQQIVFNAGSLAFR